jgi:hypothetical protein
MLYGGRKGKETPMTRRSAILANLLLSLPMVTCLLGTAPSASAQTEMKVTIPFDFSIGNHHLAGGSYSVERISDCFVQVRNTKTSDSRVLVVRKESGSALGDAAHLVFQREGGAFYLTQAWFTGADEYVGTAKLPKRDVEYANTAAQVSRIEVASAR